MSTETKTNVMRALERAGVPYTPHSYPHEPGQAVDGRQVAALLGVEPARVFKTLVARGHSGQLCVFVLPVDRELDRKKAAAAAGEKAVELLAVKELLPLTGYVRGGCSPIGMKKTLPTVFDRSALAQPSVLVSAGRIGAQVECAPAALIALAHARTAEITLSQPE